MGVGTRHCRVLTVSNINSDATGVDINCGASNVEQPPNLVRAEHPTRKFTLFRFMKYSLKSGFFTVLASLLILFKKPGFSRYKLFHVDKVHPSSAVGKRHCRVLYLCLLTNAVGKPVANPQENSLFVEEAAKPAAEGRGGHPTRKFTQDVNSKVRSLF